MNYVYIFICIIYIKIDYIISLIMDQLKKLYLKNSHIYTYIYIYKYMYIYMYIYV